MGGRARPNFRDGEWIGYRKTKRRQSPRTPAHEAPNLRLFFRPHPYLAWIKPGWHPSGVHVGPGVIEVTAKTFDRKIVLDDALAFLCKVGKGKPAFTVDAQLESSSEPGWKEFYELSINADGVAAQTRVTPHVYVARR
jgi:hypothetical protein